MTMTEPKTFKVGDRVILTDEAGARRFPGVWTVDKVNPRTVGLTQGSRRLRCDPWALAHHDHATVTTPDTAVTVPIPEYFEIGQLVTMRGKPGVYVVIKEGEKINVTLLGGDGGRYWRCARPSLTKVTVTEALDLLTKP